MPAQCVRPAWVVLEMVVATGKLLFLLRTASAVASEIVSCAVAVAANATDGTSQVMAMPALLLLSHSTCNCNTPPAVLSPSCVTVPLYRSLNMYLRMHIGTTFLTRDSIWCILA